MSQEGTRWTSKICMMRKGKKLMDSMRQTKREIRDLNRQVRSSVGKETARKTKLNKK